MQRAQVRKLFEGINVWKRGSQRAPHKPLLLLYALGKCSRGEPREILFSEIDPILRDLLREFGPSRESYHPEYPFWRLQNDGLWLVSQAEKLEPRKGHTDAKKSELLKYNVTGGFPEAIYSLLREDEQLLLEITCDILERNFPNSIHEDILAAVGLQLGLHVSVPGKRNPSFRNQVMVAYEYRCAVCGFDVRLKTSPIGLEAAHIKWYQAGGPDIVSNGLALCTLHHKLFDRGVFTISTEGQIQVSEQAHGTSGFEGWLLKFHGTLLRIPQNPDYLPKSEFLKWHFNQVFRAPPRYLDTP